MTSAISIKVLKIKITTIDKVRRKARMMKDPSSKSSRLIPIFNPREEEEEA